MEGDDSLIESKRKADVERLYTPDNYVDKFEMTSLVKTPVNVIFHLIEARALPPSKEGGRPNPFAVVSLFGQKFRTVIQRRTSDCLWDREFVFPKVMLTRTEFKLAELKVRVYNANTFTRNDLIGEFNFSLEKINSTLDDPNDMHVCDHELYLQWVVLADPQKPQEESGYLRCTITVLTDDDKPASHPVEDFKNELGAPMTTRLKSMVLIPPTIKRRNFELTARIWKGRLNQPFNREVSPQIHLAFNGSTMESSRITRSNEPVWNEEIVMPVVSPCFTEYIRLELWDKGLFINKLIGIAEYISWNKLLVDAIKPIWINFYGEPQVPSYRRGYWGWLGSKPNYRRAIKDRGDTAYLGRVLASFTAKTIKYPNQRIRALPGKDISWQADYVLRVDLYAGTEIPIGANGRVQVEVTFGRFHRETHWNGRIRPAKGNEYEPWWKEFHRMNKKLSDDEEQEDAKPAEKDGKKNKGKGGKAAVKSAAAAEEEHERLAEEQRKRDEASVRGWDNGFRQQVIFTCDDKQRHVDRNPNATTKKKGAKVPGCQFAEFRIAMPRVKPDDDEVSKSQFFDVVINVFVKTFWGRKRIGFLRYSPFDLWVGNRDEERPPKWRRIRGIPDADGHVKQQPPGFLLCSLNFGLKQDIPPIRQEMQKFRGEKQYMLQAFIYQARNLRPANENSVANPFVEVSLAGRYAKLYRRGNPGKNARWLTPVEVQPVKHTKKNSEAPPRHCYRTSCRPHELNPMWYQTLMIEDLTLPLPDTQRFNDARAYDTGTLGTINPIRLTVWSDESTTKDWARQNMKQKSVQENVSKASASINDGAAASSDRDRQGQPAPTEDENLADLDADDDSVSEALKKGDVVEVRRRHDLYNEYQIKLWEKKPEPQPERYENQMGGRGKIVKRQRGTDNVYVVHTPYGQQKWHREMLRKLPFDERGEKTTTIAEQKRVLQRKKFMGRAYIDPYKALKTMMQYRQDNITSESKNSEAEIRVDYEDPPVEWVKLYDSDNDDRMCVGEVYVRFVLLSKESASGDDSAAAVFAGKPSNGFKRTREPFPFLRPYKAFLGLQMLSQIPLNVPLLVREPERDEEGNVAAHRGKRYQARFLLKSSVPPAFECQRYMDTSGYADLSDSIGQLKFHDEVFCFMDSQGLDDQATRALLVNQVLEVDVPMPPPTSLTRKHAPALTLSIGSTRRSKLEATLVLLLGDYLKVSTTGVASESDGWQDDDYEPSNEYPYFVCGGDIRSYQRHKRKQFGECMSHLQDEYDLLIQNYTQYHAEVDATQSIIVDCGELNAEYGREINDAGWAAIERRLEEDPVQDLGDNDEPASSTRMIELQEDQIVWPGAEDRDVKLKTDDDDAEDEVYERYVNNELELEDGYKDGLDTWPLLIGYAGNRPQTMWERMTSTPHMSMGLVGCIKGKVAVVSRRVHELRGINYWTSSDGGEVFDPNQLKTWQKLDYMRLHGTDTPDMFPKLFKDANDDEIDDSDKERGNPTLFWPALDYHTWRRVEVRVYVYRASNLVTTNGRKRKPRPYLDLSVEGQPVGIKSPSYIYRVTDKAFAELNPPSLHPEFFKMYLLDAIIPNRSFLRIKVLDDEQKGDMIGETCIDLSQRWFNQKWQHKLGIFQIPSEYRTLYDQSAFNMPQGKLEIKLEMYKKADAEKYKYMQIGMFKPMEWELRLVIWHCKNTTLVQDNSRPDLMITAEYQYASSNKAEPIFPTAMNQASDVFKGAKGGMARFDWRYVFRVKIPSRLPRLKIQLWSKKLLKNDYVGEASINLTALFNSAAAKNERVEVKRQWVPLYHPAYFPPKSQVSMELSLVPKAYADEYPVGLGQDAPNREPFLGTPAAPGGFANFCTYGRIIMFTIIGILLIAALVVFLYLYFTMGPPPAPAAEAPAS